MKIAVVGLGKMGAQIAQRLVEAGHQVIALDPNPRATAKAAEFGALAAPGRAEAVALFGQDQPVVWLMIPAKFVTEELTAWVEVLPANSIIVDGGNTDFRQTIKHAQLCQQKQINLVDVGVSGGILGTANGFSMMAGGHQQSYQVLKPILDAMAAPHGGYDFFGAAGSGHYVKMVHNAIEYGMMESLAEGYRMLKEGPYQSLDLAKAGQVWQKASVIESTLNRLASKALAEDQELSNATGYVAESGEARWTLEVAKQQGIEMPAVQAALDVRVQSVAGKVNFATKLLAELRNKFGGHDINKAA